MKIFQVLPGNLNVAEILQKYFWFEPQKDGMICEGCWSKVLDFHEFYGEVEEAHRRLTERYTVKKERKSDRSRVTMEAVAEPQEIQIQHKEEQIDDVDCGVDYLDEDFFEGEMCMQQEAAEDVAMDQSNRSEINGAY